MSSLSKSQNIGFLDKNDVPYGIEHVDNKIRTSSVPYYDDIARSAVSGSFRLDKFGAALNVGTSLETVWDFGGIYAYLTSAEQLKVSSSDVNDTSAGTGARTIELIGQNGSYVDITETVSMNGTTAVTTTSSFLRIFRIKVLTVGSDSSQTNIGNISAKNNAETVTQAYVAAGNGQTLMALWTVPAGKTFYMLAYYMTAMGGKDTDIFLMIKELNGAWRVQRSISLIDDSIFHQKRMSLIFTEKTDIEMRAKCKIAGGFVSAGFDGWYE